MPYILSLIIAALLLIPGIAMAVLPVPGALYMFIVALVFAYIDGFMHLSATDISILAALTFLTMLVDFFAGMIGAKWGGAAWMSIVWGFFGFIVGSAIIPIPIFGSLAGMFIGVLASEWFRTRDVRQAHKAAAGSFLGWLAGTGFKVASAVAFIVLFVILALI